MMARFISGSVIGRVSSLLLIAAVPATSARADESNVKPTCEEEPDGVYNYMFPSNAQRVIIIPDRDYFRVTSKKINAEASPALMERMIDSLSQVGTTRNPGVRDEVRFKANRNQRHWVIVDCPAPPRFEHFNEFDHRSFATSTPLFNCASAPDAR